MTPNPRLASAPVRHLILACLRDPKRWFVHRDNLRFLYSVDLLDHELVRDLTADLELYELFHKPNTQPQKYQFVMRYDHDTLLIHISLTPADSDPPRVKISVHRHNLPGPPLPLIPIKTPP